MTSEVVKMTVTDKRVKVECNFVFTNKGPACSVRMGFPDYGTDEDQGRDEQKPKPPKSHLTSFHSYVNGKPIKTALIRSDSQWMHWHAKTVSFPANGKLTIRDTYTSKIGIETARIGMGKKEPKIGSALTVGYILDTGASWHSPIGRAEIDITFHNKRHGSKLHIANNELVESKDDLTVRRIIKGMVIVGGPSDPKVHGQTLRFVRTNFRQDKGDNVNVDFGFSADAD